MSELICHANSAPLRVLIVISELGFGGAERQVVELANHCDPRRVDLHLCSLSAYVPLATQLVDRGRLHIIRKHGRYDLTVIPRLARLLSALRIDVVHGVLFDAEIAAALAGRLTKRRGVVGSERNSSYEIRPIQRFAYRLTRSCFDRIVANSKAGAAFNQRTLGFPAGKYRVVRNGVDTARFRPLDRLTARAALGLHASKPLVGMFASLKEQKNHPLLLRAAQQLAGQRPEIQYLFVGDAVVDGGRASSEYANSIRALATALRLDSVCRFLGHRTDLPELYSACDLTVLPSRFEGTPNAVLESMACGTPVIVTNVADNAQVAPDQQVGRVVPPEDQQALAAAIRELVDDPQQCRQLGLQARLWAEQQFSLRALCEQMTTVYAELAQMPRQ